MGAGGAWGSSGGGGMYGSGSYSGGWSMSGGASSLMGWSQSYFLTYDGVWRPCPQYTIPTEDGYNCAMPYCRPDEVFLPDGRCEKCPKWTRPVHHGFYCRAEICLNYESLQEDGSCLSMKCPYGQYKAHMGDDECMSCPLYSRPNRHQDGCRADRCTHNQIHTREGHCQICPPYEVSSDWIYTKRKFEIYKGLAYGTSNHEEVNGSEEGRDFFFNVKWEEMPTYNATYVLDATLWEDPTKTPEEIMAAVDELQKNSCVEKICPPDRVLTLNGHCDVCPEGLFPIDNNKHCGSQEEADAQAADAAAIEGPAAVRRRLNNEFIMG
jgi:hypothetical protein